MWFNAEKMDPEGKKWNKVVDYVRKNPEKFFDDYGDYKQGLRITMKDIQRMLLDNVEDVLLGNIDGVNELIEDDFEL